MFPARVSVEQSSVCLIERDFQCLLMISSLLPACRVGSVVCVALQGLARGSVRCRALGAGGKGSGVRLLATLN